MVAEVDNHDQLVDTYLLNKIWTFNSIALWALYA